MSDITIKLTEDDAQEVMHKIGVMVDSPELQADYKLSQVQADELYKSIPIKGGAWVIPEWARDAVSGEIADHAVVLRDIASDARSGGEVGQSLRISKQAKRFEKFAGLLSTTAP